MENKNMKNRILKQFDVCTNDFSFEDIISKNTDDEMLDTIEEILKKKN